MPGNLEGFFIVARWLLDGAEWFVDAAALRFDRAGWGFDGTGWNFDTAACGFDGAEWLVDAAALKFDGTGCYFDGTAWLFDVIAAKRKHLHGKGSICRVGFTAKTRSIFTTKGLSTLRFNKPSPFAPSRLSGEK